VTRDVRIESERTVPLLSAYNYTQTPGKRNQVASAQQIRALRASFRQQPEANGQAPESERAREPQRGEGRE
jgi:hypothetical protein